MARKNITFIVKTVRNTLFFIIAIILLIVYIERSSHRSQVAARIPKTALKYIFHEKVSHSDIPINPYHLRSMVNRYRKNGEILNADFYGPIKKDTVVLVVTVHELSIYVEFLLVSLSQVRGIEEVLLVFSHSYFDENLNKLIQSIDFCRVMQIFYPYSTQMYPVEFPGENPGDCPHNMNIQAAKAINCTGAKFPDIHGHFRHSKNAHSKHFWWWTSNMVFETLLISKNHKGIVVFMKDDLFILADFLYFLLNMKDVADSIRNCEFITVDCTPYSYSCIRDTHGLEIKTWVPKEEPGILAFDATVWNSVVSHYDIFCGIDDYSWFRSLFYISMKRRDGPRYRIISTLFPRTYKTSSCGLDGILVNCDAIESVYQVLEIQKTVFKEMYVDIDGNDDFSFDYVESNGGWSDPRDKELCTNLTITKIRKVVMEMRNEFVSIMK